MTRFARAEGSKSSNKKTCEDATQWQELKSSKPKNKIGKKKDFVIEDGTKVIDFKTHDKELKSSKPKNKIEKKKDFVIEDGTKVIDFKAHGKELKSSKPKNKIEKKKDFVIEDGKRVIVIKSHGKEVKRPYCDLPFMENEYMTKYENYFVKIEIVKKLNDIKKSLEKKGVDKTTIAKIMLNNEKRAHSALRMKLLSEYSSKASTVEGGQNGLEIYLPQKLTRKFKCMNMPLKLEHNEYNNHCNEDKPRFQYHFEENDVMSRYEGHWVLKESVFKLQSINLKKMQQIIDARTDGNEDFQLTNNEEFTLWQLMHKEIRLENRLLKYMLYQDALAQSGPSDEKVKIFRESKPENYMVNFDGFWIKKDWAERLKDLKDKPRFQYHFEENDVMSRYEGHWVLKESVFKLQSINLKKMQQIIDARTDGNEDFQLTKDEEFTLWQLMLKEIWLENRLLKYTLYQDSLVENGPSDEKVKIFRENKPENDMVNFDGFWIKKDWAERLEGLKEKLLKSGVSEEEIKKISKEEGSREEKLLKNEKERFCFRCHQHGHSFSLCPQNLKDEDSTGMEVCFKVEQAKEIIKLPRLLAKRKNESIEEEDVSEEEQEQTPKIVCTYIDKPGFQYHFEENDVMSRYEDHWILKESVFNLLRINFIKMQQIIDARTDGNEDFHLTEDEENNLRRLMYKEIRLENELLKNRLYQEAKAQNGPSDEKVNILRENKPENNMVNFDGFWVKKNGVKRLKVLREKLLKSGVSGEEIKKIIKKKGKKEERLLKKEKKLCLRCLQPGHMMSICPLIMVDEGSTGLKICFKFGSALHMVRNCPLYKTGAGHAYATCYICNEVGHISLECRNNPKGGYPTGGCCNECGSIMHYTNDCPERMVEQAKEMIKLPQLLDKRKNESIEEEDVSEDEQEQAPTIGCTYIDKPGFEYHCEENDVMTRFEDHWVLKESVLKLQSSYNVNLQQIIDARTDGNKDFHLTEDEENTLQRLMTKEKSLENELLKYRLYQDALAQNGPSDEKVKILRENKPENDIVKFDGFWVIKDGAERLEGLRGRLRKSGVSEEKIQKIIKNGRSKAARILEQKFTVCYRCRQAGHMSYFCPQNLIDEDTGLESCLKCGSIEHVTNRCPLTGAGHAYATCYICKKPGHISRECPDNPKGLYPISGWCKECGSVRHHSKECPGRMVKQAKEIIKLPRQLAKRKKESVEEEDVSEEEQEHAPKIKRKKAKTLVF